MVCVLVLLCLLQLAAAAAMHCSTHRNRHRLLGAHAAKNRAYQRMYMSQLHASLALLLHAVTSSVSCQSSSHAYSGSCSVQREHSSQWLKMQAPLRVMHCGAPNSLSRWLRFLAALHVLMLCKATPFPAYVCFSACVHANDATWLVWPGTLGTCRLAP